MASQFPQPLIDSDSQPYWEGLSRGELRIQRCQACARAVFYPRALCPHCFSDQLTWITASGRGTLYAFTVVHQAFGPYAAEAPFIIGIIELEEGVRMMSRITDATREQITVGAAVEVTFRAAEDGATLPYFRLVA